MEILINIILFLIVLFIYVHVISQFKRSEDMEIYEMDYKSNPHLHEVCNIKQPVTFRLDDRHPSFFDKVSKTSIQTLGNQDVKLYDTNDYFDNDDPTQIVNYVVIPFHNALKLVETDTGSHYLAETSQDFIEENLQHEYMSLDEYLKPPFVINTTYSLQVGSKDAVTPLKYHTHNHHFILVTSGSITVKMTPWKSHKYLHEIKDYANYEFRSPINVWKPQYEYLMDMDKLKFLEFTLEEGHVLFCPPYWWHSIKYDTSDTVVANVSYTSLANALANTKQIIMYMLQLNNIHKKYMRTLETTPESNIVDKEDTEKSLEQESI